MRVDLAAGWKLVSLTDRVVELRKEDTIYRRFTGRDGYVRLRAEPNEDRHLMLERALNVAQRTDEDLSKRAIRGLMPSVVSLAKFRRQQRAHALAFGIPGQEEKLYKP